MKSLRLLLIWAAAGLASGQAAERLAGEQSAFLRQYAASPVDWMPWGGAAVARAKSEQKPVFLFIGSFTSELAGDMRRQTFSNPKNAAWMNQHFICVIVDRDERPDVAALYESYVELVRQVTGWPLNIWLTPDFEPYEGATYLSPSEDWGAPGFLKLADQARSAWATSPAACRRRAHEAVVQLTPPPHPPPPAAWDAGKARTRLDADAAAWLSAYDPQTGGFGDIPRLPEPELIRFMLRRSAEDREAALRTLRALATSAVRDPLDGGFFKHGADAAWHIPYQQKTLSDQARIALAYLDAAKGADRRSFSECARGALDFALGRLALPGGLFSSAEDATGDGYAGYYTWASAEIDAALGADAASFKEAHGVQADGNIPASDDPSATYAHRNILRSTAEQTDRDRRDCALLLALRGRRPAPPVDTRATAGEYGLVLDALSRAGAELHEPRYLDAARRTLGAARAALLVSADGSLRRMPGSAVGAFADDYASLALGCRDYAAAAHDRAASALAGRLLAQMDARYFDAATGTYLGAPNPPGAGFFIRPVPADDPPSAESLAICAGSPRAMEVAGALSQSLDDSSAQAPGDQLLALAVYASR
ncbi:MAG TPA: DUF255 domain-containing protein [Opitutaceae bacterium]|jgi:hypothetical protein